MSKEEGEEKAGDNHWGSRDYVQKNWACSAKFTFYPEVSQSALKDFKQEIAKFRFILRKVIGIPWWSSGGPASLSKTQVKELTSHKLRGAANKKKKTNI